MLDSKTAAHYLGRGITSQRVRDRLARRLSSLGIRSQAVLDCIRFTPRHVFVDEALSSHAYENTALPIGFGQTISQPYVVAFMTEALIAQGPLGQVLEVGTGCGYQTAILAQLADQVYTVERIGALLRQAENRLAELRLRNIQYLHGDGFQGWPECAPFDNILVAAAPLEPPPALLEQLKIGGHLVLPVGQQNSVQELRLITRSSQTSYREKIIEQVKFVPLRSGLG